LRSCKDRAKLFTQTEWFAENGSTPGQAAQSDFRLRATLSPRRPGFRSAAEIRGGAAIRALSASMILRAACPGVKVSSIFLAPFSSQILHRASKTAQFEYLTL
jgi:hypothetical protein